MTGVLYKRRRPGRTTSSSAGHSLQVSFIFGRHGQARKTTFFYIFHFTLVSVTTRLIISKIRTAALLTIANFGSAFAALQLYNQCGGGAYTGDTQCPSGSTCVEASKWYSQCIPDARAGSSSEAAAVEKSDIEFPSFGFPEAPDSGNDNQDGGEANGDAFPPPIVSAPAEEGDGPSEKPVETSIDVPVANPTETPAATPDAGSGSGGITRTIPASSGATAAATAIPVSGEFDGKMTYYDRSRKFGILSYRPSD
jgi:pectate lyase